MVMLNIAPVLGLTKTLTVQHDVIIFYDLKQGYKN